MRLAAGLLLLNLTMAGAGCVSTTSLPREAVVEAALVGDGLYTTAQADRGARVFDNVCSACHGRTEFSGAMFGLTWMADPIGNFFDWISTAMPQDDPGSLPLADYAAVVAYVMRLNGLSPGPNDLPADTEALGRLGWSSMRR